MQRLYAAVALTLGLLSNALAHRDPGDVTKGEAVKSKNDVKNGDLITVAGYLDPNSHVISPVYFLLASGGKIFPGYFPNDAAFAARQINLKL